MYRRLYRSRSLGSLSSRCGGYSRRTPHYSFPRWKPRVVDRDNASLPESSKEKAKQKLQPLFEQQQDDAPEIPKTELETRLHVTGVDLHIDHNSAAHHTEMYECTEDRVRESDGANMKAELVLRRGQDFKMTIHFNRPYDIEKNDIKLSFSLGDDYTASKNVKATFTVDEHGKTKYKPKKWGATVIGKEEKSLVLSVFVPASVPVGEWEFSIRTIVGVKDEKDLIWQYNHNEDINIIFNPWCKEDAVYLPEEAWRNECVLNDDGAQYVGNYKNIRARSWFFGQFEDGILDAAYHLLRKAFNFKACPGMGNPVKVSRLISQIVNSSDDDGVLAGNWSGEYEGGVSPCKWVGSVKILLNYMSTGKPVKYGQCWVFSGVTTTVCRALGLPCRSVTNFASAHNTDADHLSIDTIIRVQEGGDWTTLSDDSVWNFHVWNEVWLRRPDLCSSGQWDGWHVIDATPQETSDGVFCCGPAPVNAIKEGELKVGKDTDFAFAEVNADKVTLTNTEKGGELKEMWRETDAVGKMISTHKPTGDALVNPRKDKERYDLTSTYKYDEGTPKEREIVKKAERMFQLMHGTCVMTEEEEEEEPAPQQPPEPIVITIDDPGDTLVGSEITFVAHVKNTGKETRAVRRIALKVYYKTYFDVLKDIAKQAIFKDYYIDAGEEKVFTVKVSAEAGVARPRDDFIFELKAVVSFYETEMCVEASLINQLQRPEIDVKGPKSCNLTDPFDVELCFTNPLNKELTACELDIEGGLICVDNKNNDIPIKNIPAKKRWSTTLRMRARKNPRGKKSRNMSISFDCKEIQEITGSFCIPVNK